MCLTVLAGSHRWLRPCNTLTPGQQLCAKIPPPLLHSHKLLLNVEPCPLSNLTSEKWLAVWLRVGPLSFPGSILAFQGDRCGCHWAQISGKAKFLLKMSECESRVHINTEILSTSYRSLEKKSCLIGRLASKIPLGNPSSRLFPFYKIVSRGV